MWNSEMWELITMVAIVSLSGCRDERVINAAPQPFKLMFLIAALCGLRIGEVTALKISSPDFKRKLILITAALDYATRRETTPKSKNSAFPVVMPALLAKRLQDWVEKHYKPNEAGYLFTDSNGKPYLSDNVVRYGVHRTMKKLGIETPKGVHVGIHCFPARSNHRTARIRHSNSRRHTDDASWGFQGHPESLRAHRGRRRTCRIRAPIN